MTRDMIRLGLAAAMVFISVYAITAGETADKASGPKLLALYYHADW